ncbi:hypothetical protein [Delftia acidovorans]|uniref:hypothetical protein n=1 Tax=Delftia acidovorans TaxID=80866 RepID=UPI003D0982AB
MSPPYPETPPPTPPGPFWLATYFRDLAEGAVMEREGSGHPLIWSACALLSNAGYAALDEARHSGMLLYAWCGTTFFDQPTARH